MRALIFLLKPNSPLRIFSFRHFSGNGQLLLELLVLLDEVFLLMEGAFYLLLQEGVLLEKLVVLGENIIQ
jgi:hypothetical protein